MVGVGEEDVDEVVDENCHFNRINGTELDRALQSGTSFQDGPLGRGDVVVVSV